MLEKTVHIWLVCTKHLTYQRYLATHAFSSEQKLYYLHSTMIHSLPSLVETTAFPTPALLTRHRTTGEGLEGGGQPICSVC